MKSRISPSMKKHFAVSFKNISLHWRLRLLVLLLVASVLGLMTAYWVQLDAANTQLRQDTLALADQQSEQLANAVARQADDLIRGVDIGLRHMAHDYLKDPKSFVESVRSTMNGYPEGAILNISVFDSTGEAAYDLVPGIGRINVSDRDYFSARPEAVWIGPMSTGRLWDGSARSGRFLSVASCCAMAISLALWWCSCVRIT